MYGNEFGINESKIYTKNKIEPQHIYMMCIIRLFIAFLLLRHVVDTIILFSFLPAKSDKARPCQAIFKVQWLAVSSGYVFLCSRIKITIFFLGYFLRRC